MEDLNSGGKRPHKLMLTGRRTCALTGVNDVLSFDVNEILLETEQGMLMIRGGELHVSRLSLDKGEVDIDGNEIDRKKIFRDMLKELCRAGARISIYEDGEMISMKILDNRLAFLEEIRIQVERDIERELGYE